MPQPERRRYAPLGLALAGIAIVLGSLNMWGDYCWCAALCLFGTSGPFGLAVGPGMAVAVTGGLIAAGGIAAARRAGVSPFRRELSGLAALAALLSVAYSIVSFGLVNGELSVEVILFWAVDSVHYWEVFLIPGPHWTAAAGVLAAVAAARLDSPDATLRRWALARLPAMTAAGLGVTFWLLALVHFFPARLEALALATVPIALGIALWPQPHRLLPRPRAAGAALLLYSTLAFAVAISDTRLIWLLEIAPLITLLPFVLGTMTRQLPPVEPPLLGETGRRSLDRISAAVSSRRLLLGGALTLATAVVAAVAVRLLQAQPLERLDLCGVVTSPITGLLLLTGAGVLVVAAIPLAAKRM